MSNRLPPPGDQAGCASLTASSDYLAIRVCPSAAVMKGHRSDNRPVVWLLQQRPRILLVSSDDRIGGHVRERLNRECRVKARTGRERRTADDAEVEDVPALRVAVHPRRLLLPPASRAALVVRDRRARAGWCAPPLRRTHRAAELFQLPMDELDAGALVRPP